MPIPINYRKSGEAAIASYNYEDVAEGVGIIQFYGCKMVASGAASYAFVTNAIYSDVIETTINNTTDTLNFDTPIFNMPRTIKGTAYFNAHLTNAVGGTATMRLQVYKLNGATETAISSFVDTETYSGVVDKFCLVPISLTQTNIKKGDQIRLKVIRVRAGAGTFNLGHDPKGRTTPAGGSGMTDTYLYFLCPFKIDL